nr:MAG TPA: hypothetical protein [Caudoviricetes sp.]
MKIRYFYLTFLKICARATDFLARVLRNFTKLSHF